MSGSHGHRRSISAHNLPVSLSVPRPRASAAPARPAAAFLAQLLATGGNLPLQRSRDQGGNAATTAYRTVERSDVKRVPMGYRKTLSA